MSVQTREIIYTFEHPTIKECNMLICGDPWSFQDTKSASVLFAKVLTDHYKQDTHPVYVKQWMRKGVLVTNKGSKYLIFNDMPDKIELDGYTVCI